MSALPNEHDPVGATQAPTADPEPDHDDDHGNLYSVPEPPAPEPDDEDEDGVVDRAMTAFTPPSFWTERQPAPAEEVNRARYGAHLPEQGPLRNAAVAYGWITAAWNAKDQAKIWIRKHPLRLATAVLLLGMLLASPARPIVATILFGLPHLAFELLAD